MRLQNFYGIAMHASESSSRATYFKSIGIEDVLSIWTLLQG